MCRPNFFIVGQPKSGTTAFYEYLAGHPEVFVPRQKEIHYFCTDFHEENARLHGRALHFPVRTERDYLAHFRGWAGEPAVGEASVHYLYSQVAAQAIRRFAPAAKILVFLRNPVDFLFSWHAHSLLTNGEVIRSFDEALAAEPERRRGRMLTSLAKVPSYLFYLERARYAEQVGRFLDAFPREQVHVVVYEEFVRDKAGAYAGVLRFLGVDESVLPDFRVVNARKRLRMPALVHLTKRPVVKHALDHLVPRALRERLGLPRLYATLFLAPDRGQRMHPATRRMLEERLAPEVEALSALLGRDFVELWGLGTTAAAPREARG